MKKILSFLSMAVVLFAVSCTKEPAASDVKVSSITMAPTTLSLAVGGTSVIQAVVLPAEATNKTLTWSSSDGTKVMVSNGTVVGLAAGTSIISAAATDGSGTVGVCVVTVGSAPAPGSTLVTNINLPSGVTVAVGASEVLSAQVLPENATDKTLTWTCLNPSIASVNGSGVVTGLAEGTAYIYVTANDGSGVFANCSVTVSNGETPGPGPEPTGDPVLVTLANATIQTNAPMRNSTWLNGADVNAMGGTCSWANWFWASGCHQGAPLSDEMQMRQNRMDNYFKVSNLWDGAATTSYHTNTDFVQTGDAVASADNVSSDANYGQHFIQVTLPASARKINIYLQNDSCPADDAGDTNVIGEEGFILSAKGLSTNYETIGTFQLNGRGATGTFNDIVLSTGDYITEFRITRNCEVGWTYCQNAFGIAEMKVWTVGTTSTAGTPSDVTGGGGETPSGHTKVPVTAPSAPAGYTKVDLSACTITTNNPMQYVSYGFSTADGWLSTNSAITAQQKTDRKAWFDQPSNMWDGDKATSYHTNFDIYNADASWTIRTGALVADNYIMVQFPRSYSNICVWICNPSNGERMGYTTADTPKGHYHAYVEFQFSNNGSTWSCGSPWAEAAPYTPNSEVGSECMWEGLTCSTFSSGFSYLKIQPHVGETSSGTFDGEQGFFGIGELAIFAK